MQNKNRDVGIFYLYILVLRGKYKILIKLLDTRIIMLDMIIVHLHDHYALDYADLIVSHIIYSEIFHSLKFLSIISIILNSIYRRKV